jgi:hypothetical protein
VKHNLNEFELKKARRLEELSECGDEIHFSFHLVDNTFLLKKNCIRMGGVFIHEFGIYHAFSGENIYFHRCDQCKRTIRISEEFYNRAKKISNSGGDYIDE